MTIRGRSDLQLYLSVGINMSNVTNLSSRPKILLAGNDASDLGGSYVSGTLNLISEIYNSQNENKSNRNEIYVIRAEYDLPDQTTETNQREMLEEIRRTLDAYSRDIYHPYDYEMHIENIEDEFGFFHAEITFIATKEVVAISTYNVSEIDKLTLSSEEYDYSADVSVAQVRIADLMLADSGTRMFILHENSSNATLYQYDLSTAYDVSTASFVRKQTITTDRDISLLGFNDGNNIYFVEEKAGGGEKVTDYALSTQWDISSLSLNAEADVLTAAYNNGNFNLDGTRLYLASNTEGIKIYSLSTAYDLSTLSLIQDYSSEPANTNFMSHEGLYGYDTTPEGSDIVMVQYAMIFRPYDSNTLEATGRKLNTGAITNGYAYLWFEPVVGKLYIMSPTAGVYKVIVYE